MAERRMISRSIIESDRFLDLSFFAQLLYFHLAIRADDEGFVNNARMITRMIGASSDDLDQLINAGYLIQFDSGIVVLAHWHIHNQIRKDRLKKTKYLEEKAQILLDEGGVYVIVPDAPQNDNQMASNDGIEQDSIGEDSIAESRRTQSNDEVSSSDCEVIIDAWNELPYLKDIKTLSPDSDRCHRLKALIASHGTDAVLEAINLISESEFLLGQAENSSFRATFDWFTREENFLKVYEGNYITRRTNPRGKKEGRLGWIDGIE